MRLPDEIHRPPLTLPARRRLTTSDLLVLVAVLSLPIAAVVTTWKSTEIKPDAKIGLAVLTLLSLVLSFALRRVAQVAFDEQTRWLDLPLAVLYMIMSACMIVSVVCIGMIDPFAGALVAMAHVALLFYLVSWD